MNGFLQPEGKTKILSIQVKNRKSLNSSLCDGIETNKSLICTLKFINASSLMIGVDKA